MGSRGGRICSMGHASISLYWCRLTTAVQSLLMYDVVFWGAHLLLTRQYHVRRKILSCDESQVETGFVVHVLHVHGSYCTWCLYCTAVLAILTPGSSCSHFMRHTVLQYIVPGTISGIIVGRTSSSHSLESGTSTCTCTAFTICNMH